MEGWDWFFLLVFLTVLLLLFFAAFGGTNITDDSVEDYMRRLMRNLHEQGRVVVREENHSVEFYCINYYNI